MKTLPLRDLLREPSKVKKLTAMGHEVRITDRGVALWHIVAASRPQAEAEAAIAQAWEESLKELEAQAASGSPSTLSAAQLLIDQRREDLR
jgi:antitoxin (DNA-binding transcriptional repressor) of toxin-antitoxin stability system